MISESLLRITSYLSFGNLLLLVTYFIVICCLSIFFLSYLWIIILYLTSWDSGIDLLLCFIIILWYIFVVDWRISIVLFCLHLKWVNYYSTIPCFYQILLNCSLNINVSLSTSKNCIMSSAKKFDLLWRSFMKIKKRRGPRIDPWGTPTRCSSVSDLKVPLIQTICFLLDK